MNDTQSNLKLIPRPITSYESEIYRPKIIENNQNSTVYDNTKLVGRVGWGKHFIDTSTYSKVSKK